MKVIYRECDEPVYQIVRHRLSRKNLHAGFSAREICRAGNISLESVIEALCQLQEYGICIRCTDDWTVPVTESEQWILCEMFLTIDREYTVLGIEADMYRIMNDLHEPVLFHPHLFHLIDATEPDFWICADGEDGERYCYPQVWNESFLFEDYHDHKPHVKRQFWNDLAILYPETFREHAAYARNL